MIAITRLSVRTLGQTGASDARADALCDAQCGGANLESQPSTLAERAAQVVAAMEAGRFRVKGLKDDERNGITINTRIK
jgi:hypothetical protein